MKFEKWRKAPIRLEPKNRSRSESHLATQEQRLYFAALKPVNTTKGGAPKPGFAFGSTDARQPLKTFFTKEASNEHSGNNGFDSMPVFYGPL